MTRRREIDPRDVARVGFIYLIHFATSYKHARHYLGFAERDVAARLLAHKTGQGANLMRVITEAGIDWSVAAIWHGTRDDERALKNTGGASRYCPMCSAIWTPRFIERVSSVEEDETARV